MWCVSATCYTEYGHVERREECERTSLHAVVHWHATNTCRWSEQSSEWKGHRSNGTAIASNIYLVCVLICWLSPPPPARLHYFSLTKSECRRPRRPSRSFPLFTELFGSNCRADAERQLCVHREKCERSKLTYITLNTWNVWIMLSTCCSESKLGGRPAFLNAVRIHSAARNCYEHSCSKFPDHTNAIAIALLVHSSCPRAE